MARKLKTDGWLFSATLILLAIGVAAVYSASVSDEDQLLRQGMWVALGTVGLFAAMHVEYGHYRHPRVLPVLFGLTLVALVGVFFCRPVNGGHRWLGVGSLGVQPSEFAKLVLILLAATALAPRLEDRAALGPAFARIGLASAVVVALVLKEPDGGGAVMLAAIVGAMTFVSGLPFRWVGLGALLAPVLGAVVIWLEPYRGQRLLAFLDPEQDPLGFGYQPLQALIAVGTGGWWGKGYMAGVQRMGYLPEARNDYIYAVIAEERGLVGASLVLLCFAVIAWRGFRVARSAPDAFGSLLALGLTAMLGLQALYNMSVVVNLVPAKGIPLPFVSAGGSSMLVSLFAMGVLLNISQKASATPEA